MSSVSSVRAKKMPRQLAWRLFKHEAKRGELSIILFAIILSVQRCYHCRCFLSAYRGR